MPFLLSATLVSICGEPVFESQTILNVGVGSSAGLWLIVMETGLSLRSGVPFKWTTIGRLDLALAL